MINYYESQNRKKDNWENDNNRKSFILEGVRLDGDFSIGKFLTLLLNEEEASKNLFDLI